MMAGNSSAWAKRYPNKEHKENNILDVDGTFEEHRRHGRMKVHFGTITFPNCSVPNGRKLPMFATAATLALLGFAIAMLAGMLRSEGRKIVAALQGNSWTSQPPLSVRPMTVRFSPRYPASRPLRARPAMRAAA